MTSDEINELRKKIKRKLKKERYEHSEGVAYTAAALAMRYDPTLVNAALCAGLLHDCAKHMDKEKLMQFCEAHKISTGPSAFCTPALLHSKVGAMLAQQTYKITDPQIISAIAWHTTGKPDMSLLEKIIFISDYIEPNRSKIEPERMAFIRQTAFEDMDRAVYEISHDTLRYLKETKTEIDEETCLVYAYYKDLMIQKNR